MTDRCDTESHWFLTLDGTPFFFALDSSLLYPLVHQERRRHALRGAVLTRAEGNKAASMMDTMLKSWPEHPAMVADDGTWVLINLSKFREEAT